MTACIFVLQVIRVGQHGRNRFCSISIFVCCYTPFTEINLSGYSLCKSTPKSSANVIFDRRHFRLVGLFRHPWNHDHTKVLMVLLGFNKQTLRVCRDTLNQMMFLCIYEGHIMSSVVCWSNVKFFKFFNSAVRLCTVRNLPWSGIQYPLFWHFLRKMFSLKSHSP